MHFIRRLKTVFVSFGWFSVKCCATFFRSFQNSPLVFYKVSSSLQTDRVTVITVQLGLLSVMKSLMVSESL